MMVFSKMNLYYILENLMNIEEKTLYIMVESIELMEILFSWSSLENTRVTKNGTEESQKEK